MVIKRGQQLVQLLIGFSRSSFVCLLLTPPTPPSPPPPNKRQEGKPSQIENNLRPEAVRACVNLKGDWVAHGNTWTNQHRKQGDRPPPAVLWEK
ncbi:hypothetical protein JOQ06_005297, partial [Pogonophryne albipinna]